MKGLILFLGLLLIFNIPSFSQANSQNNLGHQYTELEKEELKSNANFDQTHNNAARIDFSGIDKNIQGEIKDELVSMGDKIVFMELDESLNEMNLKWTNEFSVKELVDLLAHFGINNASLILPW